VPRLPWSLRSVLLCRFIALLLSDQPIPLPPASVSPDEGGAGSKAEKVNKWNCVFRVRRPRGITPGEHHFRTFVVVGSLEDVRATLAALHEEFRKR